MHYKKPGQISISRLLESKSQDGELTLRDDLMEHHDYEAVSPDIWNLLVAWHGFVPRQTPIMRLISFD